MWSSIGLDDFSGVNSGDGRKRAQDVVEIVPVEAVTDGVRQGGGGIRRGFRRRRVIRAAGWNQRGHDTTDSCRRPHRLNLATKMRDGALEMRDALLEFGDWNELASLVVNAHISGTEYHYFLRHAAHVSCF